MVSENQDGVNELTRLALELQGFCEERRWKFCTPEDLVVMKAFADRDLDWNDIRGIIVRQGKESLDWSYMYEHLTPLCEAKEAPEILKKLKGLQG